MNIQIEIAEYKTMEEFAAVFSREPIASPATEIYTVLLLSSKNGELLTDFLFATDYADAFATAERRFASLSHLTVLGISEGLNKI